MGFGFDNFIPKRILDLASVWKGISLVQPQEKLVISAGFLDVLMNSTMFLGVVINRPKDWARKNGPIAEKGKLPPPPPF